MENPKTKSYRYPSNLNRESWMMNHESWLISHFAFCDVPLSLTHAVDVLYDSNRFLADALLYLCLLRIQKDSPRKRMARTIPCKIRSSTYFWWSIQSISANGLTSRIALYGPALSKRFNIFDFRRLPLAYLCDSLLSTQIEVIVDRIISNTSWNFTMVYFKLAVTALFALTFSDARLQANVRMIHIDRDRNGGFGEMPCCRGTRCFRQFVNLDTPLHISHLEFFFLSSFSLRPTGRTWGSNYMRPKRILQVPIHGTWKQWTFTPQGRRHH